MGLITVLRNFLLRGLTSFGKFILVIFVARQLSIKDLGIYAILIICIDYGRQFIGLSFYVYLTRELSKFSSGEWPRLFCQQLYFHSLTTTIVLPLSLALFIFKILPSNLLVVFLVLLSLEVLNVQIENYMVGASKSNMASFIVFLRTGVWIYFIVLFQMFFNFPVNLLSLCWVWAFAEAITLVIALLIMSKTSLMAWKRFSIDIDWIKKGTYVGFRYFVIAFMLVVVITSSRLVLQGYYNEEAVGIFSFFFSMCAVVTTLMQGSVMIYYLPKLLKLAAVKEEIKLKKKFLELFVITCCTSFLFFLAVFIICPALLEFIAKNELIKNIDLLPVAILSSFFFSIAYLPHYYLYVHQGDDILLKTDSLTALLSIVLSFALIPKFGIWGAAIAFMGSNLFLMINRFIPAWRLWNVYSDEIIGRNS